MMRRITQSRWFYRLLSLFFALMLFFIANSRSGAFNIVSLDEREYENSIYKVPIELQYNGEQYFVSGYPTSVKVDLKSNNRILLNTESNEQTRNFRVVADLSEYKEGTVNVPLKIENIRTGVTAAIEEKTIPVTIEKRVEKQFEVEPLLDTSGLPTGYEVSNLKAQPAHVKIVSGDKTMESIQKIVVPVTLDQNTAGIHTLSGNIQALDREGNSLPFSSDTQTVEVNLKLKAPTKTVKLNVSQTGSLPSSVQYYNFALSQDTVEISGNQKDLDKITQIDVSVNISGIKETVIQDYKIPLPQNITSDVSEVRITITPTLLKNDSSGGSSTSKSGTNSAVNSSSNNQTTFSSSSSEAISSGKEDIGTN